jgi:hypothetical protein
MPQIHEDLRLAQAFGATSVLVYIALGLFFMSVITARDLLT